MRFVSRSVNRIKSNDDDYYFDPGTVKGETVYGQEKEQFTGLYDHEGNGVYKVNDFKMGFL